MRKPRPSFLAIAVCAVVLCTGGAASGEDLLQVYREAQKNDPTIAAARSQWEATQERVPQARSALLPQLSASGQANINSYDATINSSAEEQLLGELQPGQPHVLGVAAALPPAVRGRARPGARTGLAVRLHVRDLAAGPHHPHVGRVLRRAARRVQHRARRAAEEGGGRAARAGEAQLRGRHGDDHRHQRGAGEVRLDRRDGDPGAQRPRPPPHGADGDHRPAAEEPEAHRPRLRRRAAEPEQPRLLGRPRAEGEPVGALLAVELRDRVARSRPRARGALSDARPRRERRRAGEHRVDGVRFLRATRARRCWASC